MKFSLILLALAFFALLSCEDDPPIPKIISEIKAFDLDNNGNAADIRVDFSVSSNENVREYRMMIVPAKDSTTFKLSIAKSIPEQGYIRVSPQPFLYNYSVNRLPAGFLDVNGATITNGITYVTVVLVEKNSDFQLSGFSRPFTLQDQGIYSGRYWMGRVSDCVYTIIVGGVTNQFPDFQADGFLTIDLFNNVEKYHGLSQCGNTIYVSQGVEEDLCKFANLEGSLEFTSTGTQVENFTLRLLNGNCPVYVSGYGVIEDDIFIRITAAAERCSGTCNETWTLIRQY